MLIPLPGQLFVYIVQEFLSGDVPFMLLQADGVLLEPVHGVVQGLKHELIGRYGVATVLLRQAVKLVPPGLISGFLAQFCL